MTFTIIVASILGVLFLLAYMTRRRFGVLTLALAAGSILAELWSHELTPLIANLGVVVIRPPLVDIVSVLLILAPSLVLLFSGPAAHQKLQRIVGSLVFALLAVLLMFDALTSALVLDQFAQQSIDYINPYRAALITVCLVLAVIDVLQTHTRRSEPRKKKA